MATLPDLTKLSPDQLIAVILAQQEAARAAQSRGITFRINNWKAGDLDSHGVPRPKDGARGITVTGINRNGVTLYAGEFLRLIPHMERLKAFIEKHHAELAWKDDVDPYA